MIYEWVRLLPYWIVMKVLRHQYSEDGRGVLRLSKDYPVSYYQVSEGEFVVYSQDIQDMHNKRKTAKRDEKTNHKLDKINKMLDRDVTLKRKLETQFDDENDIEY